MTAAAACKSAALVLLTPLVEKNVMKTAWLSHVPVVISMSRLIVLGFAVALLRQVALAGVTGWPEATLCIAIVLALPVLSGLERLPPERAVALLQQLVGRFGVGGVPGQEPSKFDDHRAD